MTSIIELSESELRSICKQKIENLERWIRRIVNDNLSASYGEDWINFKTSNGDFLINSRIRNNARNINEKAPERTASRPINALYLNDLISIICNEKLFKDHFSDVFKYSFPEGREFIKHMLERLVPIRNKLSHSNPISIREAEEVICYSNDFLDGLKMYYQHIGEERMYNVPMIIRLVDSFGNEFSADQISRNSTGRGVCQITHAVYSGDILSLEVFVDPSFDSSSYDVKWLVKNKVFYGTKLIFRIDDSCIGMNFAIYCSIISKDHSWHRCTDVDDSIAIIYSVLPAKIN